MTERFYWTDSNGQVLVLENPYRLTDLSGPGVPAAEIQTQKAPFQQGRTLIDQLLNERTVMLTVAIVATTRAELMTYRARLARLFNPLSGEGVLAWEQAGGSTYRLDAVPEGVEFPGGDAAGPTYQTALVSLIAANPFWYQLGTLEAVQLEGGLEFPFEFPISFATVKSASLAVNDGDVAAPVVVELLGPCLNPKASNLTAGKHMQVTYNVPAGSKIRINTAFGQKEVTLVDNLGAETNVMNYLTTTSEFWDLIPGANELQFAEEGSNPAALMLVTWRNRYVGR